MDFESTGKKLDEEIRRVVNYLETEVLPSARKDTGKFLRYASKQLERLAQKMDEDTKAQTK